MSALLVAHPLLVLFGTAGLSFIGGFAAGLVLLSAVARNCL